eukprot:TRINITY_DN15668_c0_g1_i1.p1 TRINITY_DN15668_c0_g1~~TRINITY_DN15668_c0_g1_i1.p1  ORF type:complete len:117 (+),score=2.00 TRINITY_DN15668_c0_g1_i1:34-384(+)
MATSTPGIQQLLMAEKKASEKVTAARKKKGKQLKAAKEEAKEEIEQFRVQAEQTYKEREKIILGSRDDVKLRMDQHQKDVIRQLNEETKQHKEKVIARILELVCDVKPELHVNYKS